MTIKGGGRLEGGVPSRERGTPAGYPEKEEEHLFSRKEKTSEERVSRDFHPPRATAPRSTQKKTRKGN